MEDCVKLSLVFEIYYTRRSKRSGRVSFPVAEPISQHEKILTDLVFWMNIPAFYQSDLFRALASTSEVNLHVIYTGRITGDRVALGWQEDLKGFDYEFLSGRSAIADAVRRARNRRHETHIVNGLWAGKVVESVLSTLMISGSKYYIYSEAPDPRAKVSFMKAAVLNAAGKAFVRSAAGILPISHFAMSYFKSYGADEGKMYPFGYFRSMPTDERAGKGNGPKKTIDVVFVGQLVHRKGVDILVESAEPILRAHDNLVLHLIGTGELEQELKRWIAERNLSSRIILEGALEPRKIIGRITDADLLVLPSRWDGWGLVVNEALMAGTPVLVSSSCGASDVIAEGSNGYVFRSGDREDLVRKLDAHLSNRSAQREMRMKAQQTGKLLTAENAAEYLLGVLKGAQYETSFHSDKYPWLRSLDFYRNGDKSIH